MNKQANRSIRRLLDLVRSGRLKQSELIKRLEQTAEVHKKNSRGYYLLGDKMYDYLAARRPGIAKPAESSWFSRLLAKVKGSVPAVRYEQTAGSLGEMTRGKPALRRRIAQVRKLSADEDYLHRNMVKSEDDDLVHRLLRWKNADPGKLSTPLLAAVPVRRALNRPPLFTPHMGLVDDKERIAKLFNQVGDAYRNGHRDALPLYAAPFETVLGRTQFKKGVEPVDAMRLMVPSKTGRIDPDKLKEDPSRRIYRGMAQRVLGAQIAKPGERYFYSGIPGVSMGYAGIDSSDKLHLLTPAQKQKMLELLKPL
jgi:hypothetical protein